MPPGTGTYGVTVSTLARTLLQVWALHPFPRPCEAWAGANDLASGPEMDSVGSVLTSTGDGAAAPPDCWGPDVLGVISLGLPHARLQFFPNINKIPCLQGRD